MFHTALGCNFMKLGVGLLEQIANFFVGDLREMPVPETDGNKGIGRQGAQRFVHLQFKFVAYFGCGNRDGHHETCRMQFAQSGYGSAHGRARGQAIVYQDDRSTTQDRWGTAIAIQLFSSLKFPLFVPGNGIDDFVRNPQSIYHIGVQHAHTTGSDGPHGQLWMTGGTQLAHHKNVQRHMKLPGYFRSDLHSAPGQTEHNYIRPIGIMFQLGGQIAPRFHPITK